MTGLLIFTALVVLLAVALVPAHRRAQQKPQHRLGLPSDVDDFRVDREVRDASQRELTRELSRH